MARKQNRFTGYGFPVLTNATVGPLPRLRRWVVPTGGLDPVTIYLRDGSVGFLIVHMMLWWHEKLEPITGPVADDWGYADRPNTNDTQSTSEHAGGGAADVNATRHPNGVPLARTFTPRQIVMIRARLLVYRSFRRPCLGWGGNFRGTIDGMHIERANGATLKDCERVARRLMRTPRGRRILEANPGVGEVIRS